MHYLDEIYHSGYLDGYYTGMALYHSDNAEITDEEKAKARRRKRRRNIALGVGGAAALGVGGYAVGRALRKRRKVRPRPAKTSGPKLERVKVDPIYDIETPNGWDFKKNRPKYAFSADPDDEHLNELRRLHNKRYVWDHDMKKEVRIFDL